MEIDEEVDRMFLVAALSQAVNMLDHIARLTSEEPTKTAAKGTLESIGRLLDPQHP